MKYCDACRTPYPADYSTCPKDQTALRLVGKRAVIRMDPGNPKANDALRRLREDRDRRERGGGPPPR